MKPTWLSAVLLAVVLPFAVTGVASASSESHPPEAFTLSLTIATSEGVAHSVNLRCSPTGGTHPSARAACRELRAVNGEFAALQDQQEPAYCTMEYRPVTASADGMWRGRPVSWQQEFGNPCDLRTSTGSVFQF